MIKKGLTKEVYLDENRIYRLDLSEYKITLSMRIKYGLGKLLKINLK